MNNVGHERNLAAVVADIELDEDVDLTSDIMAQHDFGIELSELSD